MRRGIYVAAAFGVLGLAAAIVTTSGAQVYPSRWYADAESTLPTTAFDSIHATAIYLVTADSVPFECNEDTAGHLVVVKAPGTHPTSPPTGTRSHYLCICAYVYNEDPPGPPHPGWMWALTDADNNPIEDCEPDP